MPLTKFYSSNSYIYLPTIRHPKVALAIDNKETASNAFKLYNPFSKKAKALKNVFAFFSIQLNFIGKFFAHKQKKSKFISYLEKKFHTNLISSIYLATTKDKVVLQLQTFQGEIIGYLKFPLNDLGMHRLLNEKRAIDLLSSKEITTSYLSFDHYENTPFILLSPIEGQTKNDISNEELEKILSKFKRDKTFSLSSHPRVIDLQKKLYQYELPKYLFQIIEKLKKDDQNQYLLVYEHGDFAPWNIIYMNDTPKVFDYEYFTEEGMEYFDLIKYYYQTGKLLKKLKQDLLIKHIYNNIKTNKIQTIFQLFLIKEIIQRKEEDEIFSFEIELLKKVIEK